MMEDKDDGKDDLKEFDLLLAVTYINDAKSGRNMHFRRDDEKYVRAYVSYNYIAWKWLLYVCIWANLALAIFEEPAIPGCALPYWATMIFELIFLIYFLVRLFHHMYFEEGHIFWKDPKNITVLVITVLIGIDMLCFVMWKELAPPDAAAKAVRWSRPFRPLYLINFPQGRQIRKAFRNIRRTLPDVLHVLILFTSSTAVFALMATKLFQNRGMVYPNGNSYLPDILEAFWDLYVLVTTANNPDVMMPAYDNNNWSALFFIVYLIVNLYTFMSIVLAVIYNSYKMHLKNEVKISVYQKRRRLAQAFDIMKTWHNGQYVVTSKRWNSIMLYMYPTMSVVQTELYLYVLTGGNDQITRSEFMTLADLLNVPLSEVKDKVLFLEKHCSTCFMSYPSELLKMLVKHRFLRYFFALLIVANAVCMAVNFDDAEWFFLAIFTMEIILKLYAFGPIAFFTNPWDIFDFIVISAALVASVIEASIGLTSEGQERTLDFILVLRVLRLVRLAGSIERFQVIITTIANVAPSILIYGGVIFVSFSTLFAIESYSAYMVFFYIYGIIGMECFKGKITYYGYTNVSEESNYCGNPRLKGSEFFIKQYCSNNFNDVSHAFVLLFELMVVNQWQVLTSGFVLVTNKAARLYFISFHMIVVILLLNIFTAFVLEVFMLEYTLNETQLENVIESRIKDMGLGEGQHPAVSSIKKKKQDKEELVNEMEFTEIDQTDSTKAESGEVNGNAVNSDAGMRFKLNKNGRKRVELLLQHMFEGEIDPNDDGADLDLEQVALLSQQRPRKLTLDNVT